MKLSDLIQNISNMTPTELEEHVRKIRADKYVAKPAVKKRIADEEKKEKNAGIRGMGALLSGLTEEQKMELIKQLEGNNG